MLRKFVVAVFALLIGVVVLYAADVKGKVKKNDKGTLTVTVDGKDVDFNLKGVKGIKYYEGDKEVDAKDKDAVKKFRTETLKEGAEVTIIYDKDGDKTTVKEIKVKK